jgi:hypothetical protein
MVVPPMTTASHDNPQHRFSHSARRALCAVGLSVALGTLVQPAAAEEASIRRLMTPEQFRAAGLEKLTEEELRALDAWLRGQPQPATTIGAETPAVTPLPAEPPTPATAPPASTKAVAESEENFGLPEPSPAEKDAGKVLRATIVSPFRGWSGKTKFKLDNGQIWQQRVSGRYTYAGDDTRVVITVNGFGFYEMELLAAGRSVGVKRLK